MNPDNPKLNNPYEETNLHYSAIAVGTEKGSLINTRIVKGWRVFDPDKEGQAMPTHRIKMYF
jgi:hypothetical protein